MPEALPSHTLVSVLSRIQADRLDADPELARKVDVAFGKHEADLHRFCAKELRGVSAAEVEKVVRTCSSRRGRSSTVIAPTGRSVRSCGRSRRTQEVIHLRWVLDYANEDIAEQMGMASTDAVRVVVQRSKRRLAKEIVRILEERSIGQSLLEPNRTR